MPTKMKEDYYQILGIERTATEVEIKSAFRRQAMKFHPDRNPGNKEAEEQFKKVNEAFSVLSDPQKSRCMTNTATRVYRAQAVLAGLMQGALGILTIFSALCLAICSAGLLAAAAAERRVPNGGKI